MTVHGTNRRVSTFVATTFLVVVCGVALIPLAWSLSTSLKSDAAISSYPPRWIPERPTLIHYFAVLHSQMNRYIFNSVFVSMGTILFTLFIASHAAYALSRLSFRGRDLYSVLLLATMMMPGVASLVPVYMLARSFHLLDTYILLMLIYSAWLVPESVWLLRGFFDTIPSSLDKAAMVDGYSRAYSFYKIVLPLSRLGLAASAIMVFVYVWNEFIIALTLTSSDNMRLVQVGLHYYVTLFGIEWGELTAAIILSLLPVIVLFLMFQRGFVKGLLSGAIKS